MASEQRSFVYAIVFIMVFTGLLITIPSDFQGQEEDPEIFSSVDPSLLVGFEHSEGWNGSDFVVNIYDYELPVGSTEWIMKTPLLAQGSSFEFGSKVLWFGAWLGVIDSCRFINSENVDRTGTLKIADIDTDAENGTARYDLISISHGTSKGVMIIYWNTTAYTDASDAWDNDGLHFLHGLGIDNTSATMNVFGLIIGLLTLSLPNVPFLVNLLLATPVWASVVFLFWYLIKETTPFL